MIDYIPKLPQDSWSTLGGISLSNVSVSPNILWGIFLFVCAIIIMATIILYYHWLRYGFGDKAVLMAQVLYTLVVIFGVIAMISNVASYGKITA